FHRDSFGVAIEQRKSGRGTATPLSGQEFWILPLAGNECWYGHRDVRASRQAADGEAAAAICSRERDVARPNAPLRFVEREHDDVVVGEGFAIAVDHGTVHGGRA